VAERLVAEVGRELTEQSEKTSVGRYYFTHRILAVGTEEKGKCQCKCKVCADARKFHTGKPTQKYTTIYC
jgi:hypothetical protein